MKSNEAVLTLRQNIINTFKQYEYILLPVLRFILSFTALKMLRDVTGYTGVLSGVLVLIGVALIGAFASADWIIILTILLSTVFIASSNLIFGLMVFTAMCIIYFLFARLFPRESILIIAVLIAFNMHIEMAVPIIAALFTGYISVVAIIIGTILWFTIPSLKAFLPAAALKKDEILSTVTALMTIDYKELLIEPEMMISIVIFFIVFTTIYLIRKQSIDYAPYIAIGVGAVMNILGFGLAMIFFNGVEFSLILVILQSVFWGVLAVILQFLSIALDYQRAETVNFEDDDNYYYVKVIPKIQLTHKHKTVKKVYTDLTQTGEIEAVATEEEVIKSDLEV